jgi:hypothetical protein
MIQVDKAGAAQRSIRWDQVVRFQEFGNLPGTQTGGVTLPYFFALRPAEGLPMVVGSERVGAIVDLRAKVLKRLRATGSLDDLPTG